MRSSSKGKFVPLFYNEMRYAVIYMVNCPLDKKSTFRDNRLRMQNSCRLLHNMTYNALKTSEMSRQCLNMAPAAKVAAAAAYATATPHQRLVALATRAAAT